MYDMRRTTCGYVDYESDWLEVDCSWWEFPGMNCVFGSQFRSFFSSI